MKPYHLGSLLLAQLLTACGAPSDERLVGWWKFDETAGDRAADSSGNGNTGTVRNGQWGEGVAQGALLLDGSGDSVVIVPMSETLSATADQITVAARAIRSATHNVALIAHGYPTLFFGFHGSRFKFEIRLDSGRSGVCYADPKYRAEPNRWYHVAATYNGWVARLYVDGKEICNDWTYGAINMPDVPFTIGAYLDDEQNVVDEISGRVDDVRIYARALSASEIRALAGPPG